MPITTSFKHTTPRKASAVLALLNAKHSYRSIVHLQHVSLGTIARIQKRAKEHPEDPTATRPRPGRPSKFSDRGKRAMVRYPLSDRQLTTKTVAARFKCCESTVVSVLRDSDYHKRIQRKKPHLTKKQKLARLKFASVMTAVTPRPTLGR